MKVIHQTTTPGQWVGVPFTGNPITSIQLAIALPGKEIGKWQPAFLEDDKVLIRCPRIEPGSYEMWMKQGESRALVSKVKVI